MFPGRVSELCPGRDEGPNLNIQFEGCHSPSAHCFSHTPRNDVVLSVENGVSNFHDDFFSDPQCIWKRVIDFQIFEDFPDMFPKLVSRVMTWRPENIHCRISVLFNI